MALDRIRPPEWLPLERRLAEGTSTGVCDGQAVMKSLQTVMIDALINFSLLDSAAAPNLWARKPLLGQPRPGAIRIVCTDFDLNKLRVAYAGSVMLPLVQAIRPLWKRRHAPASPQVAVLVLADYPNFFHQMGSVVITWAALQAASSATARSGESAFQAKDIRIFLLGNASIALTSPFWSPGLSQHPPQFVGDARLRATRFSRVVLVAPATETWWWGVWREDSTDRRVELQPFVRRMLPALLPPQYSSRNAVWAAHNSQCVQDGSSLRPRLICIMQRRRAGDRRLLNAEQLALALEPLALSHGLCVGLHDFSTLRMEEQVRIIRSTALLIGAHGAGLVWNLFLPKGAGVLELLNENNANRYYANQCRWMRRPYATWQNTNSSREVQAVDDVGKPLAPFRNHMYVDTRAVCHTAALLLSASLPMQRQVDGRER